MTGWRAVVATDDLGPGQVVERAVDGEDVVVWRTEAGEPCVMEARCPHTWTHLGTEGAVQGDELVCTAHFWRFATDGSGSKVNVNGRRDPKGDIRVYECRERDGQIEVADR